jgi:hypothetical protein
VYGETHGERYRLRHRAACHRKSVSEISPGNIRAPRRGLGLGHHKKLSRTAWRSHFSRQWRWSRDDLFLHLARCVLGRLKRHEPLARCSTFRRCPHHCELISQYLKMITSRKFLHSRRRDHAVLARFATQCAALLLDELTALLIEEYLGERVSQVRLPRSRKNWEC